MSQVKREIRPTVFRLDIMKANGDDVIVIQHPMEGDAYVYTLDPELRKRLHAATGPKIEVARGPVPDPPPERMH